MKKKGIISVFTMLLILIATWTTPLMYEVKAADKYASLEDYVKTQTYLGNESEVYYGNLNWKQSNKNYLYPMLDLNDGIFKNKNIGYYIADFDNDGENELLTFGYNYDGIPTISIRELVDGEIKVKAYTSFEESLGNSLNITPTLEENGIINCFVYPKNGMIHIGIEKKEIHSYLANGVELGAISFIYHDGMLNHRFSTSYAGSDLDEDDVIIDDAGRTFNDWLSKEGFNCSLRDLFESDIETTYSDYMPGSQLISGIRQEVISDASPYSSVGVTIPNFTERTFFNLGNTNPTLDSIIYRVYNNNNGEHIYTYDVKELGWLEACGWINEGVSWRAPATGAFVYRLYNPASGEHHYTTDLSEKQWLVSTGWNDEGVGWCSADNNSVPVYRLFNPHTNIAVQSHVYTTDVGERDWLISIGWNDEGIGWYGM